MTINAKIIADSIGEDAPRLTTLQLRYPKFIHGEAKTHRVLRMNDKWVDVMEEIGFMDDTNLSRNASSSRAIPVERLIKDVIDDPVYPMHWGKNQPGMQADEEHNARIDYAEDSNDGVGSSIATFHGMDRKEAWDLARERAVGMATAFTKAGYHKQIVNRLLEPFCHINVVVTATEWSNFFALRCHPGAQPEMRILAEAMRDAMEASKPVGLKAGDWHLPYIEREEWERLKWDFTTAVSQGIRCSVARCARVSYLTQEGKQPKIEDDLRLYERLVGAVPLHASPAEHQATPDRIWRSYEAQGSHKKWEHPEQHGNFDGWIQFRKTLEGESQ